VRRVALAFQIRKGIIVGEGRYSNSLRILFDGSKLPVSLHRDYIEQIALN